MKLFNKGHKKGDDIVIQNIKTDKMAVNSQVEDNLEQETDEVIEMESDEELDSQLESDERTEVVEKTEDNETETETETEPEELTVDANEELETELEGPTESLIDEASESEELVDEETFRSDEEKSLEELDEEVEEEVRRTQLLPLEDINEALECMDSPDEDSEDGTKSISVLNRTLKIIGRAIGGVIALLLLVYLIGTIYFHYNFFYNTTMNGADVSFKSVSAVHASLDDKVMKYTLTMVTSEGTEEVVDGSDINIGYIESKDVATALDLQMAYKWPMMFFKERQFKMDVEITFNEDILVDIVNKMDFANPTEIINPTNAYPAYVDGSVVIMEEGYGNKLHENVGEILINAVYNLEDEIVLIDAEAYISPEFNSECEEIEAAVQTMNTYLNAEINYNEGELIDVELIGAWLKVDRETLEVSLDSDMVEEFVKGLESKYNTNSSSVTFTNPVGKKATVTGGNYGYRVNVASEVQQITTDIKSGTNISREIKYSQKGTNSASTSSPFGDTYVCLDITLQKVYMLYKGSVVLTSDVVTGSVSGGMATPQGVYTLSYKTKNAVLRGDVKADGSYGYESPVSYWMPFNGGIGFHDASWRSTYGGTIYKTNGSHGCVNMPLANAAKLYEYIDSSMPIVCHY